MADGKPQLFCAYSAAVHIVDYGCFNVTFETDKSLGPFCFTLQSRARNAKKRATIAFNVDMTAKLFDV